MLLYTYFAVQQCHTHFQCFRGSLRDPVIPYLISVKSSPVLMFPKTSPEENVLVGNNFNRKTYDRHIIIALPLNPGIPELLMMGLHYNMWLTIVITFMQQ